MHTLALQPHEKRSCRLHNPVDQSTATTRWPRLFALGGLLLAVSLVGNWVGADLKLQPNPDTRQLAGLIIAAALVVYIIAMAIPFVPGIEIGLILMVLLGPKGIILVYFATQISLALGFVIGRMLSPHLLVTLFDWLGLAHPRELMENIETTSPAQRMAMLTAHLPKDGFGMIAKYPCLALALMLNLPGNGIIGGAGGIAMLAGMTRLYSLPAYLLLVAIATAPIPLCLTLLGTA